MKRKKALQLQEAWGDQPCDHPAFAKEYDQQVRTGNFVCTQCGAIVGFREKSEIMAARRPAGGDADAAGDGASDTDGDAAGDAPVGARPPEDTPVS
jgi:hypothetical protein